MLTAPVDFTFSAAMIALAVLVPFVALFAAVAITAVCALAK